MWNRMLLVGVCLVHFGFSAAVPIPRQTGFHLPDQVEEILEYWSRRFPDLTSLEEIGRSYEGRPIYALKIAYGTNEKPQVLHVGGTHGCEPVSTEVLLRYMAFLLHGGSDVELRDFLKSRELWFVPLLNPDGNQHYFRGHLAYKSNSPRRKVDLNRNFGYRWGYDNEGSSPRRGARGYRGPYAFSENESQAIRRFVLKNQFVLSFSYHSFGEQYLYPWSYTRNQIPEDISFYELYAGHLAKQNGYTYGNPSSGEIHLSNGDFDDWMYGSRELGKKKTLAMTVEVTQLFLYPLAFDIQPHFEKTLYGNLFMAEIADQPERVFYDLPLIESKIRRIIESVNSQFTQRRWVENLFHRRGEIYRVLY